MWLRPTPHPTTATRNKSCSMADNSRAHRGTLTCPCGLHEGHRTDGSRNRRDDRLRKRDARPDDRPALCREPQGRSRGLDRRRAGRRRYDASGLKDMIAELARIYDLQNSEKYRDEMTCIDPATGRRISVSWLWPRSAEDLKRKRRNSELWNELSWGQLGRSPDILAPYIISALHLKDHPKCDFGDNIENYYKYCMSHDLFLTHAPGDPQVDRSTQPQNEQRTVAEDEEVALHVVEETKDGVIVTGGKQLSTAAPHSHECYVSLVGDLCAAQQSEMRSSFLHSDQLTRAQDPGARAGVALVRVVGPSIADARRAGLHAVLRPGARPVGPALYALRSDADGEDAWCRWQQRQFHFLGWSNLCRVEVRMRLMTAVATRWPRRSASSTIA